MNDDQRQQQMEQAEEILGDRLEQLDFAKALFFGRYAAAQLPPYPTFTADAERDRRLAEVRDYCQQKIDPVAIDRNARIPDEVIAGLGQLGVLGACLPKSCGGLEWSQTDYCRILEILGGHCGGTALFVNAHHSIGPRALVLFGTPEQQQKWLPKLASGEWISAFALTEPEAGSDAANVQTTATPTTDGKGFLLNGEKRWITNGGIAQVLTVMARTPSPDGGESKITAFLVTPDMEGFEVVEERMEKCGVRGTATSRLAFHEMFVPKENVLGRQGKGLRVALTVLDFGRTTFGASCTGAAKFCVAKAVEHANRRVQFQQTLGSFELVKEKLAYMQAGVYAMESCTYQTAALIDSGVGDFMLETAMLKVFSTEVLWRIINDTFQLYGGLAYFTDQPFERMMRDARINTIGEGANDVLRAFTALVGMRDVGMELEGVLKAAKKPLTNLVQLGQFAGRKLGSLLAGPTVVVRSEALENDAQQLSALLRLLGQNVERALATYQLEIVDRQHQLGRIADAATEIYVCACVINRLDALLRESQLDEKRRRFELQTARYYLRAANTRIRQGFKTMWDNHDEEANALANAMLQRGQSE
ncbi:acyl-CoA dehydrogenase family protein [Lignipirellula cremea]|uniref:Putative acyl-CoA dehydrogenase n=1 Tax=Lignipirellula cremea TaxID=2528010 RepID=A0A518E1J3_9BACT|nr:acyl-CoA dehydrogenase family protein [Lignipirellula cremea]QDU97944.1 putative acyl-CoA dehydrogenase [Lignipirellula cremea]